MAQQVILLSHNPTQRNYAQSNIAKVLKADVNMDDHNPSKSSNTTAANLNGNIHFLLCKACFWCASLFININYKIISLCPLCGDQRLESLPIGRDEAYKFGYDSKSGIMIEFMRS